MHGPPSSLRWHAQACVGFVSGHTGMRGPPSSMCQHAWACTVVMSGHAGVCGPPSSLHWRAWVCAGVMSGCTGMCGPPSSLHRRAWVCAGVVSGRTGTCGPPSSMHRHAWWSCGLEWFFCAGVCERSASITWGNCAVLIWYVLPYLLRSHVLIPSLIPPEQLPYQDPHLFVPPSPILSSSLARHAPHLFTSRHLVVGLKMEHVIGTADLLGCRWCLLVEFLDFLSGSSHIPGWDP